MKKLSSIFLSGLMVASLVGISASAEAARGSGTSASSSSRRSGQSANSRQRRTRSTARNRSTSQRSTNRGKPADGLKNAAYLTKVKAKVKEWIDYSKNGEPGAGGQVYFNAAGAILMSAPGIKQTEVRAVSYGEGNDRSQRIRVTGVKNGKWSGHLVGWVSTHDLGDSGFAAALARRVAGDRVKVSYDYGPGTKQTVIKSGVKGQEAVSVAIKALPLNPNGITRVIYDRVSTNGPSGRSDAYVGRIVEIEAK